MPNYDRYLRRKAKRKARAERPLQDLMNALNNHVVPTIHMMKGFYNAGDFQAVGKGIQILVDCFSEFEYVAGSEQPTESGEAHATGTERQPASLEHERVGEPLPSSPGGAHASTPDT